MHRSSGFQGQSDATPKHSISWEGCPTIEEWLRTQPTEEWKDKFDKQGYLVVNDLITKEEVAKYLDLYNRMISNEIDASSHRHDLGNHETNQQENTENIMQIMWPSLFVAGLDQGPMRLRAHAVAKVILGDDMAFDFDMLLSKAPHTNTTTPWHQDESYWPDMPDKRAVTCWCALDDVIPDNGCMWFIHGSHKLKMRPHRPVKEGCHVMTCDGTESEGCPQPLSAGSCTFHHGRTLHYTRGNTTERMRRAYANNFRPGPMVEYERQHNFDHGKTNLKDILDEKAEAAGSKAL